RSSKVKNTKAIQLALIALAVPALASSSGLRAAAPATNSTGITNGLPSPDASTRQATSDALFKQYVDVTDQLMARFEETSADTDRRYGSARHWAIVALGQWRVERAVPKLIEAVDFEIDPATFP